MVFLYLFSGHVLLFTILSWLFTQILAPLSSGERLLNSGFSSLSSCLSFSFLHHWSSLWIACRSHLSRQLFPAGFRRVKVIIQIYFSGLQNRSSLFIMIRPKFNDSSKIKFLFLQNVHIFVILQYLFNLQKGINLFILRPARLLFHPINQRDSTPWMFASAFNFY